MQPRHATTATINLFLPVYLCVSLKTGESRFAARIAAVFCTFVSMGVYAGFVFGSIG